MAEQWLSIVEYARATGISDMTIRRRIRTGRISAELREGKYYIPVATAATQNKNLAHRESYAPPVSQPLPSRPLDPRPVKNHPSAERSHYRDFEESERYEQQIPQVRRTPSSDWKQVPEELTRPLVSAGLAHVEARALIEFCDHALVQAKSAVSAIESRYSSKIEALHAQIQAKDLEVKSLNQQIEDLQLLVQILERKKIG